MSVSRDACSSARLPCPVSCLASGSSSCGGGGGGGGASASLSMTFCQFEVEAVILESLPDTFVDVSVESTSSCEVVCSVLSSCICEGVLSIHTSCSSCAIRCQLGGHSPPINLTWLDFRHVKFSYLWIKLACRLYSWKLLNLGLTVFDINRYIISSGRLLCEESCNLLVIRFHGLEHSPLGWSHELFYWVCVESVFGRLCRRHIIEFVFYPATSDTDNRRGLGWGCGRITSFTQLVLLQRHNRR